MLDTMNAIPSSFIFNREMPLHAQIVAEIKALVESYHYNLKELHNFIQTQASITQSSLVLQRILQSDPYYISHKKVNKSALVEHAILNATQDTNKYFWDIVKEAIYDKYYPFSSLGIKAQFSYQNYTSNYNGAHYLDFTLENVVAFLDDYVFQPVTKEIAVSVLNSFKDQFGEDAIYFAVEDVKYFVKELNTYSGHTDLLISLMYLHYLEQDSSQDWLNFINSYHLKFMNDADNNLFRIKKGKEPNDTAITFKQPLVALFEKYTTATTKSPENV
ncbi:hypothetical protein [Acinetobacter sp. P1(2025)]|uniref:hypothetical protein n=1 Tax=Acinetobacter sp. P1(2025) TaxID=3446120 RepID=UPI003F52B236